MKVLHLTNNYPTLTYPIFGIFVKEQIESLKNLGIYCDVLFINGREKGKFEYVKSIFRIRKYLKLNQYDIIHCHHAISALCLIISGAIKENKVIVSFQNDPENEFGLLIFKFIKRRISQSIFKNNSKLIVDSRCSYLANGVNTSFFIDKGKIESFERLGLDKAKTYILFVSSNFIRKQKRYDRFKEVLRILKAQYNWKDLEELVLINTRRDLVPYYFSASSLHLLTSDFEGSPNSVKESMCCDTPVVSTPVGNVKEMLSGANNCFVTNSFDPEELAFYCDKALKTTGTPRDIIIQKKLDIESVALKLKQIYTNVANN
jgi:glycosyltransferase involved in cell wall biosynthesis